MATPMFAYDAEQSYMEMLDECYPQVTIAGSTFCASTVLKDCDPVGFGIGLDEYITSMVEDGQWTVEGYEEYEPVKEES